MLTKLHYIYIYIYILYFAIYTRIKPLCCTLKINTLFYVPYISTYIKYYLNKFKWDLLCYWEVGWVKVMHKFGPFQNMVRTIGHHKGGQFFPSQARAREGSPLGHVHIARTLLPQHALHTMKAGWAGGSYTCWCNSSMTAHMVKSKALLPPCYCPLALFDKI